MNSNSGNDPMLSSIISDDLIKLAYSSATVIPTSTAFYSSPVMTSPMDCLSPALSDLVSIWSTERRDVLAIKTEEEDTFSISSYTPAGEMERGDVEMKEIDIDNSDSVTEIKQEIQDDEYDESPPTSVSLGGTNYKQEAVFHMSDAEARRYVEENFEKIAHFPNSKLSQLEKIEFILAKSDCSEFSVEDVMNFDKRSPDSARACAKIVQNIPQRYRWECVMPEDIPCCYTIVADCKKVSSRDKPPRPMNAFMIWAQGARRLINELCPKMQNALISEALGYCWRQKSDAFKNHFEHEKIKLRRFHNVEFPEYKYKPKTKVQKAKEKQELSLNKAKLRASMKREKLHQSEETNLNLRRTKCGRPRKIKAVPGKKDNVPQCPSHRVISEQLPDTSSAKPDIKDMLTLKILGEKRLKGYTRALPDLNITVQSAFGQLSPLEIDNSYVGDIFDDLGSINVVMTDQTGIDKDSHGQSSVYDTPANTPPVDIDDELRHSPIQPPPALSSTETTLYTSNVLPISTSSDTVLPTSLPAIHISPNSTTLRFRNNHGISLSDLLKSNSVSKNLQPSAISTNKVLESSDLLFTYVTEALSTAIVKSHHIHNNGGTDNISSMDNRLSDDNNNTIDIQPCYTGSVIYSKTMTCVNETNDLDTLHLDLNGPILSDDDMRSLLNTL